MLITPKLVDLNSGSYVSNSGIRRRCKIFIYEQLTSVEADVIQTSSNKGFFGICGLMISGRKMHEIASNHRRQPLLRTISALLLQLYSALGNRKVNPEAGEMFHKIHICCNLTNSLPFNIPLLVGVHNCLKVVSRLPRQTSLTVLQVLIVVRVFFRIYNSGFFRQTLVNTNLRMVSAISQNSTMITKYCITTQTVRLA